MNVKLPDRLKNTSAWLPWFRGWLAGKTKRARYTSFSVLSIVVMELGMVAFLIPKVSATTAGPSPATASTGWGATSTNATTCNSSSATNSIASAATSAQLQVTAYGFSIPTGATINGIQVDVKESATTATKNKITDSNVQLMIGGTPTGSNLATATTWPSSLSTVTYGSSSTLWGLTPTATQINGSTFGVAITAQNVKSSNGSSSLTASIDCINVTVTYTVVVNPAYTQSNYRFYQNYDTISSGGGGSTPSFDTAVQKNTSSAGISATWTNFFAVGANTNRYLVVGLTDLGCHQPTTVAYASVALSLIGQNTSNGSGCVYFYGLLAPATGTNALQVTPSVSSDILALVASSWYGVDQTTPYGSFSTNFSNSGSTASLSATTTTGQAVVDFLGGPTTGNGTASPSGTLAAYQNSNSVGVTLEAGSSYKTATGSTTSMGWSTLPASKWSESAIGLNGPGGTSTIDVGTPLTSLQDTGITAPAEGTPFRLRLDIGISSANLAASGQNFELQYATMAGGSCSNTISSGTWANVGTTTPVSYYNDTNLTNGLALADANGVDPTESGTPIMQEYLQSGTTTFTNPSAINTSQYGMWDFGLVMYQAIGSTTYCLRVANSSGGALDTYSQVPAITTPASTVTQSNFRFYANQNSLNVGSPLTTQNAVFDISKYDATGGTRQNLLAAPFRLRWDIGIGSSGQAISTSGSTGLVLRLQYAEMVGGSCTATASSGTWADVTTSTPIQFYTANTSATNGGLPTTNANDPTDGSNSIVYQTYSTQNFFNNTNAAIYAGQDGLWDFALIISASVPHSTSYCLRVIHDSSGSDGSVVDTYSAYPQINIAPSMAQLMRGGSWWNSSGVREYKDL